MICVFPSEKVKKGKWGLMELKWKIFKLCNLNNLRFHEH